MLSRVADSLYWLGRYAERAETNAHILDVQLEQMLERNVNDPAAKDEWRIVLAICGYREQIAALQIDVQQVPQMVHYLVQEEANYNASKLLIQAIRSNARNARDIIPNDLWVVWNELYLQYEEQPIDSTNHQLVARYLADVQRAALIATGMMESLMTRDEGFLFMNVGKWLERAEKTALIVSHLLERDNALSRDFRVNYALQLTNAHEAYTRRFRFREADDVLNFLIGDLKCTRSVAYNVQKIKEALIEMEGEAVRSYARRMLAAIDRLAQVVQHDAKQLSVNERKKWVHDIRARCTSFGPIFSETYYLTKPMFVDELSL